MNDTMYGWFSLDYNKNLGLCYPLDDPKLEVRFGNHLPWKGIENIQQSLSRPGSFALAAPNARKSLFVSQRQERVDCVSVGHIEGGDDYPSRILLLVNSEPNELNLADLVYQRLYTQIRGNYLACLSQTGPHSKFIFLAKNISLYMLGVVNEDHNFLIWSNEADLEDRLREKYNNRFLYYRFPVFKMGSMVLQSQYVCARYNRWKRENKNNLHIFSALENLLKKTIRQV